MWGLGDRWKISKIVVIRWPLMLFPWQRSHPSSRRGLMFLGTRKTIIQKNFKLQLSNSNHVQRSRWQWCHFHDFRHTCQTSTWLLLVYLMFKTKPLDAMRWKGVVGFGVYLGRFWWQKQLMRGFEVGCGPHFFQYKCVLFMVTCWKMVLQCEKKFGR